MNKALTGAGHRLVALQENLIDAVWEERPARPSTQLITLGLGYTGQHHTHTHTHTQLITLGLGYTRLHHTHA